MAIIVKMRFHRLPMEAMAGWLLSLRFSFMSSVSIDLLYDLDNEFAKHINSPLFSGFVFFFDSWWNHIFIWCNLCTIAGWFQWRKRIHIVDFITDDWNDSVHWFDDWMKFKKKKYLIFNVNISGPISSSLVNKYGCRAVTIAGSILASACFLISVWANNVLTLIITIGFGVGCGLGLIYLPVIIPFAY